MRNFQRVENRIGKRKKIIISPRNISPRKIYPPLSRQRPPKPRRRARGGVFRGKAITSLDMLSKARPQSWKFPWLKRKVEGYLEKGKFK
ncbi:hypothetical protein CEXT_775321 [Caerostris extrusa]|uniref:Uncharacterized protein n=1 Tax=Caerostris extrusa TaxID=172846 RepID=A0AAV4MI58_CAEEX|nr:hypothetical protein CEXT_775321 [Caerostris extrusa]